MPRRIQVDDNKSKIYHVTEGIYKQWNNISRNNKLNMYYVSHIKRLPNSKFGKVACLCFLKFMIKKRIQHNSFVIWQLACLSSLDKTRLNSRCEHFRLSWLVSYKQRQNDDPVGACSVLRGGLLSQQYSEPLFCQDSVFRVFVIRAEPGGMC